MKIASHITHEAVQKIGGIGSVINGLCTSDKYRQYFDKTLLYGPLFNYSENVTSRLGRDGEVFYSSIDNLDTGEHHKRFYHIIQKYNIDIVYGKRILVSDFNVNKKNEVDIVLVGINRMKDTEINDFKFKLWKNFGIESNRYDSWDYEQYIRIAVPYAMILEALYPEDGLMYHFAHEYMGIPSALAIVMDGSFHTSNKTIFYAHEVSPCRTVVERNPGHDISFYTTMYENISKGKSFEDQYGTQINNYRAELVKRSSKFDYVFAVSDLIKDEYKYFIPSAKDNKIKIVYNGIPLKYISTDEKKMSRGFIQEYISNLFAFTPDIIITHVTRLVISKGIWRDITFLYILDEIFRKYNLKGSYILLSTLIGTGRAPSDIARMESEYGWPVIHREGWPDLIGYEKDIYSYLEIFNAKSSNIKAVFLNQFGFDRRTCGMRVPEGATFSDLRIGSDVEFGFSIYEPFGIAQLETVPFGGIAALSSSCGSSFLLKKTFNAGFSTNHCILDFIGEAAKMKDKYHLNNLKIEERFVIEKEVLNNRAETFFELLPKCEGDRTKLLNKAQEKSEKLGWESIVDSMNLSTL